MINYTKIAGMGEYRKKKKPKVKTKKDKKFVGPMTPKKRGERFNQLGGESARTTDRPRIKKEIGDVSPSSKKVQKEGVPNRKVVTGDKTGETVKVNPFTGYETGRTGTRKDSKAGGGKVNNKYFTGGMVNPSYGTDFDDR